MGPSRLAVLAAGRRHLWDPEQAVPGAPVAAMLAELTRLDAGQGVIQRGPAELHGPEAEVAAWRWPGPAGRGPAGVTEPLDRRWVPADRAEARQHRHGGQAPKMCPKELPGLAEAGPGRVSVGTEGGAAMEAAP